MNPMLQAALTSILRWVLTFLAGWFVQHGIWTGSEAETYIAGASLAVVTLLWALWSRYHSRLKLLTALTMPAGSTENQVNARIASSTPNPSVTTPKNQAP